MPLVNRAPVNAAGQLMVTTTTPTAAWPSLGGMTYEPTTGELAVIDAVPGVNDPYLGGIRFTNLGAMYITTVLPSPIFYVGGLPVSADGRMFFSSAAPIGAVGGWPVAGDGGVAGIGVAPPGPVPIFNAPLTNTLVPTTAGNPTFTFARATTAYVTDNAGVLRQAIANEARFAGARRVQNCVPINTTNISTGWSPSNCSITFGATGPTGLADANTVTTTANGAATLFATVPALSSTNQTAVVSMWVRIRNRVGTGSLTILNAANQQVDNIAPFLTGTWQRFMALPVKVTGTSAIGFVFSATSLAGDSVDIAYMQSEAVDGNANQAPSEYVSVGVLSAPYHGNAINGVKYFATTNGNSVTGNVVTEAAGTPIPAATMLGYVAEPPATNLCPRSQEFTTTPWANQYLVPTINAQIAPDGTLTADTFADNSTNNQHAAYQSFTFTAAPHSWSVYLKAGALTWVQLSFSHAGATFVWANFNVAAGTLGNKSIGSNAATSSIQAIGNGWYRCTVSGTPPAVAGYIQITTMDADTNAPNPFYVGSGQTVHMWGAQMETSGTNTPYPEPSSYIPTATVAVIRNFDNLTYPVSTNLSVLTGSAYAEATFYTISLGANSFPTNVHLMADGRNPLYYNSTVTNFLRIYSTPEVVTANTRLANVLTKQASAWSGVTASICLNGGTVATGAFGAFQNSGLMALGGGDTLHSLKGSIRNVKLFNVRLTDVELQQATTL